ncbi:CASP8-associated protein 2 [Brachyistius frenatus]|uniref:CASP8-associated protein 2 n=1 Tax=Brachyistius frenatus TaxID=100188 RepID=UPI0037E80CA4
MEITDSNNASALLVPDVNEDSVDIYDGLDVSFNSNTVQSSLTGSQLKESMDLYEEIMTEEQQSRESSYTELKSRFQAAQNQIKELRRRLEQMEIQNTGLSTENFCLKKNISALLRTARQEVMRKDAEIQRLNQRSEKGRHHYPSHLNNLRAPNSSSRTATSRPLPPPPPSNPLPPPPPPPSPPRRDQENPPQPIKKERDSSPRALKTSSHSPSKTDCEVGDKKTESEKHKSKHREDKYQSQKLLESTNRRHRSSSDPNRDHGPEKIRSSRAEDSGRRSDSRSCKSKNYLSVEGQRRSGAKTSSPEISLRTAVSNDKKGSSREWRRDKANMSASDSEHGTAHSSNRSYSREPRKSKTSDGHSRSSDSKERKKSSSSQQAERHTDSNSKQREEDRPKDHQGKGDRQRDGETNRQRDGETTRQRDGETNRQRDGETTRQRDGETTRQRDGETNRQRDGETNRQRDGETNRQRDGETTRQRDGETNRQRDGETNRQRDGETNRPRDGETNKQRDGETNRQRDGETNRQRDGETNRPRDGETNRPRDGETNRPRDGETNRQRDGETNRPRDGETNRPRDGETNKQRDGETNRQRDGETNRQRDGETNRPRDGETNRPRDGETNRPRDGETNKQRDGETNRQRDGETNRRDGETIRQRDGETNRQRDGETNRQRDGETNRPRDGETNRPRDGETNKQRDGETNRQRDGETNKQRDGETNKQRDGETNRQRDGETNRQRDGETNRQRDGETNRREGETKRQRDGETNRQRDGETNRPRDGETNRQRDGETNRPRDGETNRRDGETNRSRDGETNRSRDGETNRQRDGETIRKHKSDIASETSREREKQKSRKSDHVTVDVQSKKRQKRTHEGFKRSSEEPSVGAKSSVEENSPNRKLCFMETLNLTLSPIKKPVLRIDGDQKDKDVETGSEEENSQPDFYDMCVIDEVNTSEFEAELGYVAERSPGNLEALRLDKRLVKDVQEAPAGEDPVQTTSAQSQAGNQTTARLKPKPAETSSLKAVDISKDHEDKTKVISDSLVAECGPPEGPVPSSTSGSSSEKSTGEDLQTADPGSNIDLPAAVTEPAVLHSSVEPPKASVKKSVVLDSPAGDAVSSHQRETSTTKDTTYETSPKSRHRPPTVLPQVCQQGRCPPDSPRSIYEKDGSDRRDGPKDADAVSSTISLESLPQEGLSLTEAIYVLTQTTDDDSSLPAEPSSSSSCIGVPRVSSTTEERILPERYRDLTVTPKNVFSPGKRQRKDIKLSSSAPLLHDEDSMMHTLSNLKSIPDAISPLRSPVRIAKRSLLHVHGKPGHVKSLQKEFSSPPVDGSSKKLDVNKENKYPGSPANRDTVNLVDKVFDLPSSLSDTDLEEGEILSESDETAADSPVPATKRAKLAQPVRNKASPRFILKRKSEEKSAASKEMDETAVVSTRSPKSRFKTVCPAASKASFSTIEEIMETFKLVRTKIRKKYMKLHKTFPKKSFYGVMENFQESFIEFVDGANFGPICGQAAELKSNLKKLIASVFGKISNNGIVKRIFEQQAVDLKQKLWDFVDAQVEYLFKDVHTILQSLCKPTRAPVKDRRSGGEEKVAQQTSPKKPQCEQKEAASVPTTGTKSCAVIPYRTGLGSRGKDIRIPHTDKDPPNCPNINTVVELLPPKNLPSAPEKTNVSSLVVSQHGSVLDKTDFELLTEQQASSLTFNLVRDSQMGEIFKCLLQGSDLLENNGISGENTAWSVGTPRKDGERFISITTPSKFDSPSKLFSPQKFDTPSKLIATWSSISPHKMSSPRHKDPIALNPALFDESCLLEVPSDSRGLQASHTSYSILAEDLAVSLTIPSPLKSDSHLSFLQPSSMSMTIMSTPDSVISAHISEDALMDGEDASEQDIHLVLDTDNSSCGSCSSVSSETLATPFVFKPDVPMQALVMERSNDHFIVKIRQASVDADITLTANESFSRTLTEEEPQQAEDDEASLEGGAGFTQKDTGPCGDGPSENLLSHLVERRTICQADTGSDTRLPLNESPAINDPSHQTEDMSTQQSTFKDGFSKEDLKTEAAPSDIGLNGRHKTVVTDESQTRLKREDTSRKNPSKALSRESRSLKSPSKPNKSGTSRRHAAVSSDMEQQSRSSGSRGSDSERGEMDVSESERSLATAEDVGSSPEKRQADGGSGRKRKKQQEKPKTKRSRKKEEEGGGEMAAGSKRDDEASMCSSASLSPSSLSAKNVVKKKGEVVMAWSRDEDRAILIDLKTNGASRETFSALSETLQKPSEQIAHRFHQLMKLFKKKEKMDT